MLLGSAVLTLAVGLAGHRVPARRLLLAACGLMAATGVGFSAAHSFWPLVLVGFVGTLNPSNGDVSPFLPMEQALLAHADRPVFLSLYPDAIEGRLLPQILGGRGTFRFSASLGALGGSHKLNDLS